MELLFERMALDSELPNFVSDESKDATVDAPCSASKEDTPKETPTSPATSDPSASCTTDAQVNHSPGDAPLTDADGSRQEELQQQSGEGESDAALAGGEAGAEGPVVEGKARPTGRKQPCPCGSGRKFKDCCRKGGKQGAVAGKPGESLVDANKTLTAEAGGLMSAIYV